MRTDEIPDYVDGIVELLKGKTRTVHFEFQTVDAGSFSFDVDTKPCVYESKPVPKFPVQPVDMG